MRLPKILFILLIAGTSCSCSWFSKKPPEPPPASSSSEPAFQHESVIEQLQAEKLKAAADAYKKNDITISIKADSQLNRYQNNAHTLFLCIYQLKDPNGFNQLIEEEGGVAKLLECRRFDGSVANAKRLVVQPGQVVTDTRDRAQGARFIGIVSGYYGTGKEKMTHLETLPPGSIDQGSGTTISIELGPYEIENVAVH